MMRVEIQLRNAADASLKPVTVTALVDTGAAHLCIPDHVALQLGLAAIEQREVVISDGTTLVVDYVGPIGVRFSARESFVGGLVLGKDVLLGTIPLSDLDLVIEPRSGSVTVNPESPNIPVSGSLPRTLGIFH